MQRRAFFFVCVLLSVCLAVGIALLTKDLAAGGESRDRKPTAVDSRQESGRQADAGRAANSDPALAGGETVRREDPVAAAMAAAYRARTYSSLLRAIAELGPEYALDAYDLKDAADELCSVMRGTSASYLELYRKKVAKGSVEAHPQNEASYALVDARRLEFCDVAKSVVGRDDALASMQKRRAQAEASPDYARLLEIEGQFMQDGGDAAVAGMVDVARSTHSPAVFKEAIEMLAETGWLPPSFLPPPGFDHEELQVKITAVGSFLAYCHLNSSGCAPGSLLSVRACLPFDCVRGESVQQFLARRVTPDELRAAQAYANALLALRRRG